MSKQPIPIVEHETSSDSGISSPISPTLSPTVGWGIVLLLLGTIVGWQLVQKRNSSAPQSMPDADSPIANPRHPALIQPRFTQALQWLSYGKELERSQQYEAAIAVYNQGLSHHPKDFRLWHERGLALAKLQRFEDAIASYDRAYALRPKQPDLAHERGDTFLQLGRYEEAIASFDVFLRYSPNNAHVLADRGYALYQLGRYEEALKSLNLVLQGEQQDRNATLHARYYHIESLRQLRQFNAALESSQTAVKQSPEDWFKVRHDALQQQIANHAGNELGE